MVNKLFPKWEVAPVGNCFVVFRKTLFGTRFLDNTGRSSWCRGELPFDCLSFDFKTDAKMYADFKNGDFSSVKRREWA